MTERSRNWCFTLNNYTAEEHADIKNIECKYLVVGEEVGDQKTPHLQGYVEFQNGVRLSTLKNINTRVHWESRKGTAAQAADYCKKENNYYEKGQISRQGLRTDLQMVKDEIVADATTVDEVTLSNPDLYHQYGRTLHKIEDIHLRSKYRNWMTKGIWYHGPTGAGKSHIAYQGYNPKTHYVWKTDNGWQDGYTGQETVIINDFRGSIAYNELLQMIDKWPYFVPRRGREPAPFLAKTIIITSSLTPEDAYNRRAEEDKIEQLLRRIEVIRLEAR